ncbi:MAG: transglutaminase family protein, partial [Burkholderiales bacterium]
MTIRVALHHRTRYNFDRLVALSPHEVRLRPAPHCRTPIVSYSLKVEPAKHFVHWQQDAYGNWIARYVFPERSKWMSITADLVAEMTVINPFDFFVESWAETYPFAYPDSLRTELASYLVADEPGPRLAAWLADFRAKSLTSGVGTVNMLVHLNDRLQHEVKYLVRMEPGVQAPDDTLTLGSGSCRDSGWLLVQILRHLGLAARFVSGYLIQLTADVKPLDGPAGPERDFTDLHAWAEVYLPGAGWIGLDPTSGLLAGEGHIPLAATAFPASAAPVIGFTDPCESTLDFEMKVTRIHEDPRVTKPYSDAQWTEIDALGRRVDHDLKSADVRLTQGGEPTFVSIDDMDGDEWNYTALSPKKWELAESLAWQLANRFAPGGLLCYGQGKWYPGEPLPRWALAMHWRADGKPLWRDRSLMAAETTPAKATLEDARRFALAIATRLGLPERLVITAYEDPLPVLALEQTLPENVDPATVPMKDYDERSRLARLLGRGMEKAAGFVLPLRAAKHDGKGAAPTEWESSPWPL